MRYFSILPICVRIEVTFSVLELVEAEVRNIFMAKTRPCGSWRAEAE
jgi:hypothetical protein